MCASVEAFAEIDWHDFAIVQTIDFTAADAQSELPPPMSIAEVENMTLAQKKMAAMIMDDTAPEVEAIRAAQAAADAAGADEDVVMDEKDDAADETARADDDRRNKESEETERAKAVQALSAAPIKVRKDYVPKSEPPLIFERDQEQAPDKLSLSLACYQAWLRGMQRRRL